MKDALQKANLYRHFRARGWYAMLEVPVFPRDGSATTAKLVTDVDVFGLRATPDLTWERVVGDCKTRKGESPANRALWVRALMDHFSAARGYCVLKRDRNPIEPDHKLLADGLGVTLLDEVEFEAYDRAVLYPSGSERLRESADEVLAFYRDVALRFPRLSPLAGYVSGAAWSERDTVAITRKVVAQGLGVRSEIDPGRDEHVALVLEAAAVAGIGIATCVGKTFHQHLQPANRAVLDEALRSIVWGGRERYEAVQAMRSRFLGTAGGPEEDGLALPSWGSFLELVRNLLEAPALAFRLPHLLRSAAMDLRAGRPLAMGASGMQLRLGLMLARYYAVACDFPPEVAERLKALFVPRISNEARRVAGRSPQLTIFGNDPLADRREGQDDPDTGGEQQ